MNASDLPDPDDVEAVMAFARSFNGYDHSGSFKAAADEARQRKRSTLIDLETASFFRHRAAIRTSLSGRPLATRNC